MRGDERQALAIRLNELARRSAREWQPVCSRFLAAEERELALHSAHEWHVLAHFDGGWPDAERVQCCFCPEDIPPIFTGVWMRVAWNPRFGTVDHRSLLGSLMALGMERALMGDFVLQEHAALIRATPELALRLPGELSRVGNVSVQVSQPAEVPEITPPQGDMLRDTVASLRLDSVLSAGLRTSRAKGVEWLRQGLVQVNHQLTQRPDQQLTPGDLISVRGFGRIRLLEAGAPTRKDRIPILLEIFGKH